MPHHKPMVATDFLVPTHVITDDFVVRPFVSTDNELDFEAWSSSIEHLHGIFGPTSNWPNTSITVTDNAIEAAYHEREFRTASSFAYSVFTLNEDRCLGCIYFVPAKKREFETECFYWARADELANGMDERIGSFTREWLKEWPFTSVAFPGRDDPWDQYLQLEPADHW